MAETYLDDLKTISLKHFNPVWSFPSTSVYQNWDTITLADHLKDDPDHDKDALVSQIPIVFFKPSTVLPSLGIIASSKVGRRIEHTFQALWNFAYQHHSPADYIRNFRTEGASSLPCHECVLSVIVQLSNKNVNHPQCAFADSASSLLSGMMVASLQSICRRFQGPSSCQIQWNSRTSFTCATLNDSLSLSLRKLTSNPYRLQGNTAYL